MYGWEVKIRGSTEYSCKRLYDLNGNHVGTISISRPRKASANGKKKKSPLYSFKQISSQVLQAKTATKAMQVSNSIRSKIGLLKKQLKSGNYDEEEILRAILHAEMVQRACHKKEKNLRMEETAERKIGENGELLIEPELTAEEAASDEEIKQLEQEELEALMEKLEMSSDEMLHMLDETLTLDEEMDELAEVLTGSMTPEDLEQLKVKHRSDEARDILQADLKYLKALFDRLQSEKENAGKADISANCDSGVSLTLDGCIDMPVLVQDVPQTDVGNVMDIAI